MPGTALGHWIYLAGIGGIVAVRYAGFLKQLRGTLSPDLQMLPGLLALAAVTDYGLSLWIERNMAAKQPARRAAIPVVTAAFGVSIAVYGMIAWLLGATAGWFWFFAGVAAVHWFHSALRWQNVQPGPHP
jgi:branched-subunit amino acid ABC-type transport system permease component